MVTNTCELVSSVPEAQKRLSTRPSLIQRLENPSFFSLNLSISYISRPKARTTRTPVRFSCTMVVSSPSASSAALKREAMRRKNTQELSPVMGTKQSTISERRTFMENMMER